MKAINKDKPERHFIVVSNAETVSISKETPVVFAMNGTNNGLAVKKPANAITAGAVEYTFAGVPKADMPASKDGQLVQVYGIVPHSVNIRIGTRANTTQSVASTADMAVGAPLFLDTVNNCFVAAASVGAVSLYKPQAILAQTLLGVTASIVSSDVVSTGESTITEWYGTTALIKTANVFLRAM